MIERQEIGRKTTLREEGGRLRSGEQIGMDAHERLVTRVADEQDDILGTIQLIDGDEQLQERLFEKPVDLLVEGMFLDLRASYTERTLGRDAYIVALADLAEGWRPGGAPTPTPPP